MSYNGKNYAEQGGDKWVIGGTLEIKEGATVTGLPEGEAYSLPVASASVLGGVKAAAKGSGDTVPVKVDSAGNLYVPTYPSVPTIPKAANQTDSVATEVAALVTDFNGLLAKLKAAGLITMYGYRQVNGRLEVVPEEAEIIRLAADLYLEGYGRCKLEDAFAAVNIKGRHGANMGGNSIVDLICNEKIVGDMLLQKTFVVDPITKEVRKNNGEKPQYFVEGSHEGILDRKTYEKVLAERARRAAAYKPRSGSYERNRFPFSGKIHCGKCGKSFTRKVLNGNTPYEKRGWLCRTFNQKGKAHCDAKQIPEEILKRVSAEAMGLPEFDEAAFAAKVEEIQVPENGVLVFVFYDGHTVTKTWDNPSRRHSWNPENRQRARELALRQAAERRLAKCQQ